MEVQWDSPDCILTGFDHYKLNVKGQSVKATSPWKLTSLSPYTSYTVDIQACKIANECGDPFKLIDSTKPGNVFVRNFSKYTVYIPRLT